MKELKRGQIGVNKKRLIDHCKIVRNSLNYIDKIMTEKESLERGKKIAKACNEINFSIDTIEHFELGVSINKLGK